MNNFYDWVEKNDELNHVFQQASREEVSSGKASRKWEVAFVNQKFLSTSNCYCVLSNTLVVNLIIIHLFCYYSSKLHNFHQQFTFIFLLLSLFFLRIMMDFIFLSLRCSLTPAFAVVRRLVAMESSINVLTFYFQGSLMNQTLSN